MGTKQKHERNRRRTLFLFALLQTCHAELHRNVLYWDIKPYIYHDEDGTLTGIYVDTNRAVQDLSMELCDPLYPEEAGKFNTYTKKPRSEIQRMFENRDINGSTEVLFPVLRNPREIREGFLMKSEGIAVIGLRRELQMTLKFIWSFFKVQNLFILTALCVLSAAIVMLVVVRTYLFICYKYNTLCLLNDILILMCFKINKT